MKTTIKLSLALALLCGLVGCGTSAPAQPRIRLAAASDLRFALADLVPAFRERQPDTQVDVTLGASGVLFSQLSNRAPFDVFLSADVDYPRRLVAQEQARADDLFQYAVGHLIIWVPNRLMLDVETLGAKVLLEPGVRRIALANPRHAPYGRAAEAALRTWGWSEPLAAKLVQGENISQTFQLVQSGAADAGLVSLSLTHAPAVQGEGRFWQVPADAYPQLDQAGVILSWAEYRPAAEAWRAFLLSDAGQAILQRHGFSRPKE